MDFAFQLSELTAYTEILAMASDKIAFRADGGVGLGRIRMNLPLRIVTTTRDDTGSARLTANALTGRSYTLQASEDLGNWRDLTTQTAPTNRMEFSDKPAGSPSQQFYRVKQN